jgi:hypothetical protein
LRETASVRIVRANVRPVALGDVITANIDGLQDINTKVA